MGGEEAIGGGGEALDFGPVPADEDVLHKWMERWMGLNVPRKPVCPGHQAPWEYVRSAFFEPASDLVVWAPRGGGKTRLGAAITLLDLLFKPGCQVRILGGSMAQSMNMWDHLWPDVLLVAERLLQGRQRQGRVVLASGSEARVLPQSQRAVRGVRVQKLRCDEVDLFKPDIWEAAQLVTRSREGVRGAIEAISTMQTSGGMMQSVVEKAEESRCGRVIKWCIMEVLAPCPPERPCEGCPLWDECRGKAKSECNGFVSIDDAITFKRRASVETWQSEMLCLKPSMEDAFFKQFNPDMHVTEAAGDGEGERWLAMDFGYRDPFVCLRIIDGDDGVVRVTDEYIQSERIFEEHLNELALRGWGVTHQVACDPAGQARNDQTAESNVQLLRRRHYWVHCRPSRIGEGAELVRAALRSAAGEVSLLIHPRCKRLIKAMESLRYPAGGGELPAKDGEHDHPVDALRYFFINRKRRGIARSGRY